MVFGLGWLGVGVGIGMEKVKVVDCLGMTEGEKKEGEEEVSSST